MQANASLCWPGNTSILLAKSFLEKEENIKASMKTDPSVQEQGQSWYPVPSGSCRFSTQLTAEQNMWSGIAFLASFPTIVDRFFCKYSKICIILNFFIPPQGKKNRCSEVHWTTSVTGELCQVLSPRYPIRYMFLTHQPEHQSMWANSDIITDRGHSTRPRQSPDDAMGSRHREQDPSQSIWETHRLIIYPVLSNQHQDSETVIISSPWPPLI